MTASHLDSSQLQRLRALLVAEHDRLRGRAGIPDGTIVEVGDVQDRAAEEEQFERSIRVSDHERARLVEIDAALARMDDGTYGICEETGDEIPFARLLLEPTTRYTVEALQVLEDERKRAAIAGEEADDGDQPY